MFIAKSGVNQFELYTKRIDGKQLVVAVLKIPKLRSAFGGREHIPLPPPPHHYVPCTSICDGDQDEIKDQAPRQAIIKGSRRVLDHKSNQNQDDFLLCHVFY